jgi:hypothetical protein
MRSSRISPSWLVVSLLLAACGSNTPDSKSPGDMASVEVAPVADTAAPQPEKPPEPPPAEPKEGPEPSPKLPPKQADPPQAPPVPASGPTAPSGGTAASLGAASAPTAALQALAATDAAGMLPAGSTLTASFKAGQTMEFQLLLEPGRCYAILASGAATIQQMDVSLGISMPSLPPMVLAQASGTSTASLGKSPSCFKNPMPLAMPATATVKVTAGNGNAVVQVYAK